MLSFKVVFSFYIIQNFVCGQYWIEYYSGNKKSFDTVIPSNISSTTEVPDYINAGDEDAIVEINPTDNVPDEPCPRDKSLYTKEDIIVMIDYLYNQLAVDEQLSEAYKSQAADLRDTYMQDLNKFIEWFQHQPEHLKHVLNSLGQVRVQHVEPMVKNIAHVLNTFPELENLVRNKDSLFNKILKKQRRYKTMCDFNCDEIEEHKIFKREIQNDYYCSSLEELHDKITNKLNQSMEQIKKNIINKLSIENDNYKENIKIIKNNLKNKALQEFGRTMYDILFLQDEYHHFVEDLNLTAVETKIFSLKELNVQLDDKLLQMDKAVEKYGQHCKNCGKVDLVSAFSNIDVDVEVNSEVIVDSLIDAKFNKTIVLIENDFNEIFKDLNELIIYVKENETDIANLKPIQEDVFKMTNDERQKLEVLKNMAQLSTIKNIVDLIERSKDLLKKIDENPIKIVL